MQHVSFAVSPLAKQICERLKAARCRSMARWKSCPYLSIYLRPNDIGWILLPARERRRRTARPTQVTWDQDEALRELKTLTPDKGWLIRSPACATGSGRMAHRKQTPRRHRGRRYRRPRHGARAGAARLPLAGAEQAREFGEVGVGLHVAPAHCRCSMRWRRLRKNALMIERLVMMDAVTGERSATSCDARFSGSAILTRSRTAPTSTARSELAHD